MGPKQSSPAGGRVRAYSGSDIPSSSSAAGGPGRAAFRGNVGVARFGPRTGYPSGTRPPSVHQNSINIPGGGGGGPDPDEETHLSSRSHRLFIGSLPAHLSPHLLAGFQCPVCTKLVSSDEMDLHLIMCLTKPRLTYNDDVLSRDAGECAICLDDMGQGDTIARLPCLCIYHKPCIDEWFQVNRSCPEHPAD
ncbi:E3 ubiquitin-protein ligase znrf2-like [Denticeps clupeoides]|uniref:RING-type E3 ubiquitin transferase n=1 Tax=Denticeps clupeoides TaxID=299321 RepID=A0AAY4E2J2_9TELE|nr:E3 ubiquitin-protein ligase znrf2-like [Denticeps clupeoides]XP_028820050.1 E3 ubiquitin-protein ligase znrf2-like [Denticeps clupeoides]